MRQQNGRGGKPCTLLIPCGPAVCSIQSRMEGGKRGGSRGALPATLLQTSNHCKRWVDKRERERRERKRSERERREKERRESGEKEAKKRVREEKERKREGCMKRESDIYKK